MELKKEKDNLKMKIFIMEIEKMIKEMEMEKIEHNNGNIYDGKWENNKKKGFENEEKFI